MVESFAQLIASTVDLFVRRVLVPVTSVIPALVEHGILLAVFAALWVAFGAAALADPAALASAWTTIGQLPLPMQALAWLLFLPVMAGLWIWSTDWALAMRLVLVAGVAVWNLLVFLPRRSAGEVAANPASAA